MNQNTFINYAHRGASTYAPENTLSAFYLGLQQQANGIETDLRYTKDHQLVLFHDAKIDRICAETGDVADYTLAELSELFVLGNAENRSTFLPDRIVTFATFLHHFAHLPLTFALEFKGEGVVRETYEMAKQAGILEKCIFTSFQFEDLVELRAIDKTVRAGYLTSETSQENIEKMQSIQLTQACLKAASITEEVVKRHHDAGFSIRAWGIDSAETMQHVIDCGVDAGMTINFPDVLTRALCQMQ